MSRAESRIFGDSFSLKTKHSPQGRIIYALEEFRRLINSTFQ
jgi:hypothetical protein